MLKKLIKYDFSAVLKYWWIAALSTFVFALVGCACTEIFNSEKDLTEAAYILATLGMVLVFISFVAFFILTEIFIFLRFYKNFFSDEGYLTFTLPVKRSQLLFSKLFVSCTTLISSFIILMIDIGLILLVDFRKDIFTPVFWNEVSLFIDEAIKYFGIPYLILYALEFIIIGLLSTVASVLFMFVCITIASVITKKAKIITAIGIYYGANGALTFIIQLFLIFGATALINWLSDIKESTALAFGGLAGLILLLLTAIFGAILYAIQYWLTDRKLNLS